MWRLPELVWNDSVWRLPLDESASSCLAMALLEEPPDRLRRLTQLLSTTPSLLLWILCRASEWQETPPRDLTELPKWLCQAISAGNFHVEPDVVQDVPDVPDGEASSVRSGATASRPVKQIDFGGLQGILPWEEVASQLSHSGPPVDQDFLRGCPWLPDWLPSHTTSINTDKRQPVSSTSHDGDLSRLLPRIIRQFQRNDQLENHFASELEREKIASLREFAYGASHEINNPLANIATRAQSLLREETNPDRKRKLSTIAAQAFRAHEMIADMMLFAKPPAPELQPADVAAIARAVVQEMLPDAQSQQTELALELAGEPCVALADPTQLGVAIKALVRNALEALVTGGTVAVSIRLAPPDPMGTSWIQMAVRDTGPGIAPEVRKHLFDPFYSGREAGRGLGFGLAKCWRIAELHAGQILVESEPGLGATFVLRIPIQAG